MVGVGEFDYGRGSQSAVKNDYRVICTDDPERELNLFQPRREIVERRTAESLGYYVAELHCRSTCHRVY